MLISNPGGGACAAAAPGFPVTAAAAAAIAAPAPGKSPKGGIGLPLVNSMTRAFSAAAMKLLFSASDNSGERNKNDGSMPGGSG